MIPVENREAIRKAYHLEHKSIRQIAREQHHSRRTVAKAIQEVQTQPYQRTIARQAPVLGSFHNRVEQLVVQNETMPRKQRYTARKIYELLVAEGYQGSESRVLKYISEWRRYHSE